MRAVGLLKRDGLEVSQRTVARLMIELSQHGVDRGRKVTATLASATDIEPSPAGVVARNLGTIRKSIGDYMRWYRQNGPC